MEPCQETSSAENLYLLIIIKKGTKSETNKESVEKDSKHVLVFESMTVKSML